MLQTADNAASRQASAPAGALPLTLPFQTIRSWVGRMAMLDMYRPESHYMRGPGPKCRAKCTLVEDARSAEW
jgi:hypothetical protein